MKKEIKKKKMRTYSVHVKNPTVMVYREGIGFVRLPTPPRTYHITEELPQVIK
jgi:hypothetical protein